jgi:hypothetical protein
MLVFIMDSPSRGDRAHVDQPSLEILQQDPWFGMGLDGPRSSGSRRGMKTMVVGETGCSGSSGRSGWSGWSMSLTHATYLTYTTYPTYLTYTTYPTYLTYPTYRCA